MSRREMERLTVVALSAAMLLACGPERSFDAVDPALYEATPTYAVDIAPLMDRYCVACHASDGLRSGGVELDLYDNLFAARVKNACVAIEQELVDRYADDLLPAVRNPEVTRTPCDGWERYSMPTGAKLKMTPSEQVIFVRWVVTGAAP